MFHENFSLLYVYLALAGACKYIIGREGRKNENRKGKNHENRKGHKEQGRRTGKAALGDRVSPWNTKGNKKVFQTFFLAGKWYEGEVLEVFIWVGDYYNREMFFTPHTMEEIYYEYKRSEE